MTKKDKLKFITNLVKDLKYVKLSSKCGKYYCLVYNGISIFALYYKGKYGKDITNINNLSELTINIIYKDLYQDFGE